MAKQTENETLTLQEVRALLLAELEASQQAIAELSDEQLEEIVGGMFNGRWWRLPSSSTHGQHAAATSTDVSGPSPASSSSSPGYSLTAHLDEKLRQHLWGSNSPTVNPIGARPSESIKKD